VGIVHEGQTKVPNFAATSTAMAMLNPFPGMNPYLEHPALWHQVHNRLIVRIADAIADQAAPHYFVAIEQRIYQSCDDPQSLIGIADVGIKQDNRIADLDDSHERVVNSG
jgi:hypothetical protein